MKEEKIKMTLIQGDCLKVLPTIPDESIDLVITDPPYNISEGTTPIYDTRAKKGKRIIQLNAEWDKFSDEEFLQMMFNFIDEVKRILKSSGTFICFTSDRYLSYLRHYIRSIGMVYEQTCFWIKSNPVPQMLKVRFMHATEMFFLVHKERGHDSFRWEQGQHPNIFYHPIVGGKERLGHPTQKPIWLIEELVKYTTKENMLVLDPFLGVGTTMEACRNLGRNCIGIEINPEYIEMTKKRLNWSSSLSDKIEWEFKNMSDLR
jgi:DNA modification methylase